MANVNIKVVADNRNVMGKFGALFGRQIFKAEKVQCDLKYGSNLQDIKESGGILTSRPIMRYKVVPIDITDMNLATDGSGATVVILNQGRKNDLGDSLEIRCPLSDPKFASREVTVDSVADALSKSDSSAIYFSNAKRLAEEINQLNNTEMARVNALLDYVNQQKTLVQSTIDLNSNKVSEYYKELDSKNATLEIHTEVHV